jgi:UDP-2,3-diacylglucosamine pyrophosphatase LpxH
VSDVHLGCKHSQSKEFLAFLRRYRPNTLYLVGDFVDTWKINAGWHWPEECSLIIEELAALVRNGTRLCYVPGNHDSFLRNPAFRGMLPKELPEFEVRNEFVFETLQGWRFLVTHGDLFDFFETRAQWISKATARLYDVCLSMNWWIYRVLLHRAGNPYGGCAILKDRVKRGVRFISHYESRISEHAMLNSCEGVICGHIHTPDLVHRQFPIYCNTGDWVENCTGLIEHHDGTLGLISHYGKDRYLRLPRIQRQGSSESVAGDTHSEVSADDTRRDHWGDLRSQPEEYAA